MKKKNLNTTFMIDGGAGRLITAIPALEKYARLNPNDDFRVLTAAWENLYWSHPLLQNRTYNVNQKGVFDIHIQDRKLVHPEPYHVHGYYNQEKHLIQAFDQEINQTQDHSNLEKPNLYISEKENQMVLGFLDEVKKKKNRSKVIVFQPYGSGIQMLNGRPFDPSYRSLDVDFTLKLMFELSKDYAVIFFGEKEYFHPADHYSINVFDKNPDLRLYMTLIANCDYFLGVDSVGQHMARAFDKPGTIIMGSTFEGNVSYSDYFNIYRNEHKPTYSPIRISDIDCEFASNLNSKTTNFIEKDLENILGLIKNEKQQLPSQ
jgi:hypothetical protein